MQKTRAFLKWAGGKYSLVDHLREKLPAGKRLVEPFVGAGSVFLNTDYDEYLLNDINPDLINMYKILQQKPEQFIADAQRFFTPEFNDKERYYKIREKFNKTSNPYQRSLMFLYMNRHGFNGLCRYNKSGGFNVPFGSYKKPYFPLKELRFFAEKSKKATFICESYSDVYKRLGSDDVVYCDPPYAPLSRTASFTSYSASGFSLDDQALLAKVSRETSQERNIPILISNHDIPLTRELYHGSTFEVVQVKRTISRNAGKRNKVDELLALYS
ncbi:MAG: Dam family site-specific DNA-(adenine-N6)-methyltransferase [Moritella sp.]|uniref:Dam family site-specific DNA-(adenine-N6)-methyltransferase n=1 Tax=Moritella sp. TaxID=78556 RepID=UPI0025F519DB|nr:Dam family site-specific DNA-(adenine-N6)-methyltransferase [Moritella sp.]NQZ93802.1 Dam family site-specific DNA-(adenine-N6)-methyltransferase [Moritella sp.]